MLNISNNDCAEYELKTWEREIKRAFIPFYLHIKKEHFDRMFELQNNSHAIAE